MRSLVPGYLKGPNLHNCRSISQAWPTRHFARDERESRGEGRRKDRHTTKYKVHMIPNFFTILSLQCMYSITSEVQKCVLFQDYVHPDDQTQPFETENEFKDLSQADDVTWRQPFADTLVLVISFGFSSWFFGPKMSIDSELTDLTASKESTIQAIIIPLSYHFTI